MAKLDFDLFTKVANGEVTPEEAQLIAARVTERKLRGVQAVPANHVASYKAYLEHKDFRRFQIEVGAVTTNGAQSYIGRIVRSVTE